MKTIWTTKTQYVDAETGELISETQAKEAYVIIKKIKNTQHNGNENNPKGIVTVTNKCRRSSCRQLQIFERTDNKTTE